MMENAGNFSELPNMINKGNRAGEPCDNRVLSRDGHLTSEMETIIWSSIDGDNPPPIASQWRQLVHKCPNWNNSSWPRSLTDSLCESCISGFILKDIAVVAAFCTQRAAV